MHCIMTYLHFLDVVCWEDAFTILHLACPPVPTTLCVCDEDGLPLRKIKISGLCWWVGVYGYVILSTCGGTWYKHTPHLGHISLLLPILLKLLS